jgi:peptidyl-prolyl cis-trans isomerase C
MANFIGVFARATGCALLLTGSALAEDAATPPAPPTDLSADTVVASVNGTDITLGRMIALRETLPAQYQSLADDVLFKGILDQLVQQETLVQSLGAISKRDQYAVDNERLNYLASVALKKAVEGAVTDAALQAAYDAKYKDFVAETEYHAAHILVDSEEKSKALKAQIDGGANFADLAKANSSDGSAASGGDLGWFGKGMMVKPFEDAVLAMKAGEVAGPVQTQFGWHLVKLIETRNKAKPSLDDVRADLATEIENKALQDHILALTKAAKITRPGEGIDPSVLKDQTLLDK